MYSSVAQQQIPQRMPPLNQHRFDGLQGLQPMLDSGAMMHQLPFREPQPYPRSISNAHAYGGPLSPSRHDSYLMAHRDVAGYEAPEHMLRRKTPSGTVAAAYDGGTQEWFMGGSTRKVRRSSRAGPSAAQLGRYPSPAATLSQSYLNQFVPGDWVQLQSMAADPYAWNGTIQVPTVLQPVWHSAVGPTASNPSQFFGPYWPDGSYAPYRPAFVKDRSGYQQSSASMNFSQGPYNYSHNFASIGLPGHYGNSQHVSQNYLGSRLGHYKVEHHNQSSACSTSENTPPMNAVDRYHGITRNDSEDLLLALKGSAHQSKEKTLAWAQKVYVNLLACLQKSHGKLRNNNRPPAYPRSRSQPNIYPSLPKQSKTATGVEVSQQESGHELRPGGLEFGIRDFISGQSTSALPLMTITYENGYGVLSTTSMNASTNDAYRALEMLEGFCRESRWTWVDGLLLGGCLAYGLEKYNMAMTWYNHIISIDSSHVEAISNLAATLLALHRRAEAEQLWFRAVHLRPSYFEAVEHLIGLLCSDRRSEAAVKIIDFVEDALRAHAGDDVTTHQGDVSNEKELKPSHHSDGTMSSAGLAFVHDHASGPFINRHISDPSDSQAGYATSGYKITGSDNGRILALVHAKGNLLYGLGDVEGASRCFENVVLISTGMRQRGIRGLISRILKTFPRDVQPALGGDNPTTNSESYPVLLSPDLALKTARAVFSPHGRLPGLKDLPDDIAEKAAISTTSSSLLSLAKIYQDSLSTGASSMQKGHGPSGIGDILALYYLSSSLQPSPSTANNVGILLASVHQPVSLASQTTRDASIPMIPGVVPGSGVALALSYYNYGLNLDSRHAHLFTNLGSLLKDIGQLNAAIKMYEQAVACDGTFDIALANLANAVKDQGRISDAIVYYRRAVASSPEFAEAVCGLANALNSVCDWAGRGGAILEESRFDRWHVDENGMIYDARGGTNSGWMKHVVQIVEKQLNEGSTWGRGILQDRTMGLLVAQLELADSDVKWTSEKAEVVRSCLTSWSTQSWEGARVTRLIERSIKVAMRRWYRNKFILHKDLPPSSYSRPALPSALSLPSVPTVLPFHTFTCPLTAKDVRMISQRNALRISCSTARASWLPATVYPPPAPPAPCLNIGYVSSDFNNHPLAHLMQSVFGLHDVSKVKAFCYATTPSDSSIHRHQIESESPVFHDASNWSAEKLINQIVDDEIHILVNLNGYTRGARNEIFAARPAPIQMAFMGFAGSLGAEWCDYLLADEISVPPDTLRPNRRNVNIEDQILEEQSVDDEGWVYSENIIFCRDTFFCCDHRQSSKDAQIPWNEEQQRRWQMRKELFPNLPDSAVILGNFNQLYKIEPTTFRTWLRILARVPQAILWLLRFPDLGENNLKKTATLWAGEEVASRIWFTDVAPKGQHISRARVCDLFLDTPECNAHTTAADVLWSSTPLLTLPRYEYKMCSRMAASILSGAFPKNDEGQRLLRELIAKDEVEYEESAIKLAIGLSYDVRGEGTGRLIDIRKTLYDSRHSAALFDTKRWVRDLERAYGIAWSNWVDGKGGDIWL